MRKKLLSRVMIACAAASAIGSPSTLFAQTEPVMPFPPNVAKGVTAAKFDSNPANKGSTTEQDLFVYGWDKAATDKDRLKIPTKVVTFVNYSGKTIYPILRTTNSAVLGTNANVGFYDPFDPVLKEYRGYIGYEDGQGKYRFGLKSGASIKIRVPLVFWDGTRTGMLAEGRYVAPNPTFPPAPPVVNPYEYDPTAKKVIVRAESYDDAQSKGVVMWYRADQTKAPNNAAPDQLLEWAIRDVYLDSKNIAALTNHAPKKANQALNLIDYDVSYVDTMYLPLAMEALNAKVGQTNLRAHYGWTGSGSTFDVLQNKIKNFTVNNNPTLGTYFGGKGWPKFYFPPNVPGIKVPSGAKLFEESPLGNHRSPYNGAYFTLDSSGSGPVYFASIGWDGNHDLSSGNLLYLTPNVAAATLKTIADKKMLVEVLAGDLPVNQNPIKPGTKVLSVEKYTDGKGSPNILKLDTPLKASTRDKTFDFRTPITDYAANDIAKIWYSWAQHYLDSDEVKKSAAKDNIPASIDKLKAILTLSPGNTTSSLGLVAGMAVSGPGLRGPNPALDKGGVVILDILDSRRILLSNISTVGGTGQFKFEKPKPIPTTFPPAQLYQLTFGTNTAVDNKVRNPKEFAKKVYLAMAAISQVGKSSDPKVKVPSRIQFMTNLIGGNTGFMFEEQYKDLPSAAGVVGVFVRDVIKSLLRGVTDFTQIPERDAENKFIWYPKPSDGRGGKNFNVYNLDPFVYFVHVVLGNSGYGFSLDDDKANVGAGGASALVVTYGGAPKNPPYNQKPYTPATPFGPISCTAYWDPKTPPDAGYRYQSVTDATSTTPIVIKTNVPTYMKNGDKITVERCEGNTAANNTDANKTWTISNVQTGPQGSFTLLGSKGQGQPKYTKGGRWHDGQHPVLRKVSMIDVFERIQGDDPAGAFLGPVVTKGPGILTIGRVRVIDRGRRDLPPNKTLGELLLSAPLKQDNGQPLPAGTYTWTLEGF